MKIIINNSQEIWSAERVRTLTISRITLKSDAHKGVQNRRIFKAAVSLAVAAAVICMAVFGGLFLTPQAENAFSLRAYAMERQADGAVEMREVDLLEEMQRWSSYYDGKELYLNISLKCEGENIECVDFYTDDGFFAKQYLKMENGIVILEEGVPAGGWTDAEGRTTILHYGNEFEIIGSRFTLNRDDMTDDLLLFLGMELETTDWDDWFSHIPQQVIIRAIATFSDGKTQEERLTLNFSAETAGIGIGPARTSERGIHDMLENTDSAKKTDAFTVEVENDELGEVKVDNFDTDSELNDGGY